MDLFNKNVATTLGDKTCKIAYVNENEEQNIMTFDRLKISADIKYISDINEKEFKTETIDGMVVRYIYTREKPSSVRIVTNYDNKPEFSVEFTGKILMDDYVSLINRDNILQCFDNINSIGVCKLDVNGILSDASTMVCSCDVTKDVSYDKGRFENVCNEIYTNVRNYKRWNCNGYGKSGIVIMNIVKTKKYKKRLIIYDKAKELSLETNNGDFLSCLKDKQKLLDYFNGKIRFETNINTFKGIRDMLKIDNNNLESVLQSKANPILQVYDASINTPEYSYDDSSLGWKDRERLAMLEQCNYDLKCIEQKIRQTCKNNTYSTRKLEPYRKLLGKHLDVNRHMVEFRGLIA